MKMSFEEFVSLISERYGVDKQELILIDSFEALGFDSLTLYSIVDEVEKKFSVKIDTDDITEINTLSGMYKYVSLQK